MLLRCVLLLVTTTAYAQMREVSISPTFCTGKNAGDYSLTEDACSNVYVQCTPSGTAFQSKCPGNLIYDADKARCEHFDTVDICKQSDSVFVCPERNGDFPPSGLFCSPQYYNCRNGVPTQKACPRGRIYDGVRRGCVNEDEIEGGCSFDCKHRKNGQYSVGCSAFYWWCFAQHSSKHVCPRGTIYDKDRLQCLFKEQVRQCQPDYEESADDFSDNRLAVEENGLTSNSAASVVSLCPRTGEHTIINPSAPCTGSYISCSDGQGTPSRCDNEDYIFSSALSACVPPQLTRCTPTVVEDLPSIDEEPAVTCGRGEVFTSCGTACEPSCEHTTAVCTLQCLVDVCQCQAGLVRIDENTCDRVENCPPRKEKIVDVTIITFPDTTSNEVTTEEIVEELNSIEVENVRVQEGVEVADDNTGKMIQTFECPQDNGPFPIVVGKGFCANTYYSCINGDKRTQQCDNPAHLFTPELNACLPPSIATGCDLDKVVNAVALLIRNKEGRIRRPQEALAPTDVIEGQVEENIEVQETRLTFEDRECASIANNWPAGEEEAFLSMGDCERDYIHCAREGQRDSVIRGDKRMCPQGLVFTNSVQACTPRLANSLCGNTRPTPVQRPQQEDISEEITAPQPIGDEPTFGQESIEDQRCSAIANNWPLSEPSTVLPYGPCETEYIECLRRTNGGIGGFSRQCPRGRVFTENLGACTPSSLNRACAQTSSTVRVTEETRQCQALSEREWPQSERNTEVSLGLCTPRFIQCTRHTDNTIVGDARDCLGGKVFSANLRACVSRTLHGQCKTDIMSPTLRVSPETRRCEDIAGIWPAGEADTVIGDACSSLFIECHRQSNGVIIGTPMSCAGRSVFSQNLKACVPPRLNPMCSRTPIQEDIVPEVQMKSLVCSSRNEVLPINEKECSPLYIECIDGEAQEKRCLVGRLFDADMQACLPRNLIPQCREVIEQPRPSPSTSPISVLCPTPSAIVPTSDCSAIYIECTLSKAVMMRCALGSAFDDTTKACLPFRLIAACGDEPSNLPSPTISEETVSIINDIECSEKNGVFSTIPAQECSPLYVQCREGRSESRQCIDGRLFSVALGACLPADLLPQCAPEEQDFKCLSSNGRFALSADQSCSPMFYSCLNGRATMSQCRQGELFDHGRCVASTSVSECQPSTSILVPVDEPTSISVDPIPSFTCPHADGVFSISSSQECSPMYYECIRGEATLRQCVDQRVFSVQRGACLPAHLACTPRATYSCPTPYGVFPIAQNAQCSPLYYECTDNVAVQKECILGRVYSHITGACLPITLVDICIRPTVSPSPITIGEDTNEGTIEELGEGETDELTTSFHCLTANGVFPLLDGQHCSPMYYQCTGNVAQLRQCIDNRVFSISRGACLPIELIGECDTNTRDALCASDNSVSPITSEQACSPMYIQCRDGQASTQQCSLGRLFSVDTGACLPLSLMPQCDTSTPPARPTPTTSVACPFSRGVFAMNNAQKCSPLYMECQNGVATERRCPSGRAFDEDFGACLPFSIVDGCETDPAPLPATRCSGLSEGSLLPLHPSQECSPMHVECNRGVPLTMQCQQGRVFVDGACHEERTVPQCGGRTTELSSFTCPSPRGVFPIVPQQTCSPMYYHCVDSLPTTRQCQAGFFFSDQTGACLPPSLIRQCQTENDEVTSAECDGAASLAKLPRAPGQNCSPLYVQCTRGLAEERQCPGMRVFFQGMCRKMSQVAECREDTPSPYCPTDNGVFPIDGEQCTSLYTQCTRGQPAQHSCTNGFLFDVNRGACVPRRLIAKCAILEELPSVDPLPELQPLPTPTVTVMEESTTSFICASPRGVFAIPSEACTPSYIECIDSRALVRQCPLGRLFDISVGACLPRRLLPACDFTCTGRANGLHRQAQCSSSFWSCHNGEAVQMTCPDETTYSTERQGCVRRQINRECQEFVEIVEDISVESIFSVESEETVEAPIQSSQCPTLSGVFPAEPCSSTYIQCRQGVATLRQCAQQDYIFDQSIGACLPAHLTQCNVVDVRPRPRPTITITRSSVECPSPTGVFDHPDDVVGECSTRYIQCREGVLIMEGKCSSSTLVFDALRGACVPRKVASCARIDQTPIVRPTVPSKHAACLNNEGSTFAVGVCTQRYYQCENDGLVMRNCARGLVYDAISMRCRQQAGTMGCHSDEPERPIESVDDDVEDSFACSEGHRRPAGGQCTHRYKQCTNGVFVGSQCFETNAVFNGVTQSCERASLENGCLGQTETSDLAPLPERPANPSRPLPGVDDSTSCPEGHRRAVGSACSDTFEQCTVGQWVGSQCFEANTVFNGNTQSCERASLDNGCLDQGGNVDLAPLPERPANPVDNRPLPIGGDCPEGHRRTVDSMCSASFEQCTAGVWVGSECFESNTIFNGNTQSCERASIQNGCLGQGGNVDLTPLPERPNNPIIDNRPLPGDGALSSCPEGHRRSVGRTCSTSFEQCTAGEWVGSECFESNTIFNGNTQSCERASIQNGCLGQANNPDLAPLPGRPDVSLESIKSESSEETDESSEDPIRQDDGRVCQENDRRGGEKCSQRFEICGNGQWVPQKCDGNLIFTGKFCVERTLQNGCLQQDGGLVDTGRDECTIGQTESLGTCQRVFRSCVDSKFVQLLCDDGKLFDSGAHVCVDRRLMPNCDLIVGEVPITDNDRQDNPIFVTSPPINRPPGFNPINGNDQTGGRPIRPYGNQQPPRDNGGYQQQQNPGYPTPPRDTGYPSPPTDTGYPTAQQNPGYGGGAASPPSCVDGEKITLGGDCQQAYGICIQGQTPVAYCGLDQVFSVEYNDCVPQEQCGFGPQAPTACVQHEPLGPCQDEFLHCFVGQLSTSWCPYPTVFDPSTRSCQDIHNVPTCEQW